MKKKVLKNSVTIIAVIIILSVLDRPMRFLVLLGANRN
jgi:hypothetical protein